MVETAFVIVFLCLGLLGPVLVDLIFRAVSPAQQSNVMGLVAVGLVTFLVGVLIVGCWRLFDDRLVTISLTVVMLVGLAALYLYVLVGRNLMADEPSEEP